MRDDCRPPLLTKSWLAWTMLYVAAIVADLVVLPGPPRLDLAHVAGAFLPMIPLAFALRASFRVARSGDELMRRIQLEAVMIAALVAAVVILGGGLLQMTTGIPTFNVIWLWPPICIAYAVGLIIARRRYA